MVSSAHSYRTLNACLCVNCQVLEGKNFKSVCVLSSVIGNYLYLAISFQRFVSRHGNHGMMGPEEMYTVFPSFNNHVSFEPAYAYLHLPAFVRTCDRR